MRGTLIVAAAVAALAGCSTYNSVTQRIAQSITPYRITVVQGNFVSAEMAAKMQAGMSRDQVRALLGTPLLTDMFHADRWDYLFYFKRGSTSIVQQRNFIVNFQSDRVASWSGGDNLPSELELLADIDGDKLGKKKAAQAKAAEAALAASSASGVNAAASPAPIDTVASPTGEAAQAGALPATAANAQAAQAANRATSQITSTPTNRPSVAVAPSAGGTTPGASPLPGQPQLQFHRPPPPSSGDNSNPVGPTGSQGSDASASSNQPAAASPQGVQGTGN
ncbi:outer membrane protein assembly factor BamE [Trinickia terrae]|uniref:outer membrane protein assembly factor BamE n=1 Tax=Trinickia terrae TaxID=2571161 RepID=UPI00146C1037|nr:outer membrane protein assembly factor BamE [Trinickia terrae]